jgi:hypothetical protein
MVMSPETPINPVAAAPPDRPTMTLEQWAQMGLALIFGDRRMDDNERQILFDFYQEVAARGANGGIGNGATPPAGQAEAPPPSPMDMNQNTEDMGTVEGAEPQYAGGY